MTASNKFTRWHDRQPQLAKAVRTLCLLPDEVCTILSAGMIQIMHRDFKEILLDKQFRTLGHEKILGLHKSKNRRREYDENETLHKAMNTLYLLPNEAQDHVADEVMTMMNYIQSYLATCYEFQQDTSPEDIAGITRTYVEKGSAEVENFLQNLRDTFCLQGRKGSKRSLPGDLDLTGTETGLESDKDTSQGLRIKRIRAN